ncbi:heat-inducible transcriptional repressor HrcA [Brochothrix campestris]|uniref:Heat-inducible transcription repressor HrcA n=1 Tax=Brochothrix campestris FSL F6-1037 TaxID=1265861 RepID=W7CXF8_9LIST|nr:heat-inducible transcriptional repressor HrcA [Brochothrix campestris]EUJ41662.1 heat-inducible transcription repressor [Brochothrix campestris FSL F6-1037]
MLSERQLLILKTIVRNYIGTAKPIGSSSLVKEGQLPFSSATIRNEMGILEQQGFIEKTHSSSGRVPSEQGYRYYVDFLVGKMAIHPTDMQVIQQLFTHDYVEMEELIRKSATILADLTNYTAIVLGPNLQLNRLASFQLIPIGERQVVAILVTTSGHVENHRFTLEAAVSPTDIERVVNILNDKLVNLPLSDIKMRLPREVNQLLKQQTNEFDAIQQLLQNVFHQTPQEKIVFSGQSHILNQPEFSQTAQIRDVIKLLEQRDDVFELVNDVPEGINVMIGEEISNDLFKDFSLITSTYKVDNQKAGVIALLGPTRMSYDHSIQVIDEVSKDLSRFLTTRYDEGNIN